MKMSGEQIAFSSERKEAMKGETWTRMYVPPMTTRIGVETEGGFCTSIVKDEDDQSQININSQGVGASSNYFDNEDSSLNDWDN